MKNDFSGLGGEQEVPGTVFERSVYNHASSDGKHSKLRSLDTKNTQPHYWIHYH